MKCASVYSLAALAALASAQSTSGGGLPKCATSCVSKFSDGSSIAGCGQLDVGCICSNSNFLNDIACCLTGVCKGEDLDAAAQYAGKICSSANVSVPPSVVCNETSSASPSASPTASETGGSSATPTGGAANGTASASASKTASGAATKPTSNAAAAAGSLVGVGAAALALMLAL